MYILSHNGTEEWTLSTEEVSFWNCSVQYQSAGKARVRGKVTALEKNDLTSQLMP